MTINVVGGTGSISVNLGRESFAGLSVVSPDNTPMYDIVALFSDGHWACGAYDVDAQRTPIWGDFRGNGEPITITILDAADDGVYDVCAIPK